MRQVIPHAFETFGRRFADLLLCSVTLTELVILFLLTSTFTITDWIYVLQHFIVLGIAVTRPHPKVRDYSIVSGMPRLVFGDPDGTLHTVHPDGTDLTTIQLDTGGVYALMAAGNGSSANGPHSQYTLPASRSFCIAPTSR